MGRHGDVKMLERVAGNDILDLNVYLFDVLVNAVLLFVCVLLRYHHNT